MQKFKNLNRIRTIRSDYFSVPTTFSMRAWSIQRPISTKIFQTPSTTLHKQHRVNPLFKFNIKHFNSSQSLLESKSENKKDDVNLNFF